MRWTRRQVTTRFAAAAALPWSALVLADTRPLRRVHPRIGLLELTPGDDPERNFEALVRSVEVRQAGPEACDLLVAPELALGGLDPWASLVAPLSRSARDGGCALACLAPLPDAGTVALTLGPTGETLMARRSSEQARAVESGLGRLWFGSFTDWERDGRRQAAGADLIVVSCHVVPGLLREELERLHARSGASVAVVGSTPPLAPPGSPSPPPHAFSLPRERRGSAPGTADRRGC